ncbi:hypothetical protein [Desulfobacula phenolica]|uniref:Uncharacterized protein n=1 Tax=Desulfobacula phenolica TaxID=90732 RepID=A0A1H2H5L5_9BACT|nr:hypothetical protein [Desulfobacula phenolica]SDU27161.1 hypothetical protein SAMN04487931_10659 [Desulfobacula phenolica]
MENKIDILKEVLQEKLEEKRSGTMAKNVEKPPTIRETENGKEKWCPKGKHYVPADLEHFYKDGRSKTGLSSWCRECQTEGSSKGSDKKTAKQDMVLTLDFSVYDLLFEDIKAEAVEEFRTPEMQAMWLISEALEAKFQKKVTEEKSVPKGA